MPQPVPRSRTTAPRVGGEEMGDEDGIDREPVPPAVLETRQPAVEEAVTADGGGCLPAFLLTQDA